MSGLDSLEAYLGWCVDPLLDAVMWFLGWTGFVAFVLGGSASLVLLGIGGLG